MLKHEIVHNYSHAKRIRLSNTMLEEWISCPGTFFFAQSISLRFSRAQIDSANQRKEIKVKMSWPTLKHIPVSRQKRAAQVESTTGWGEVLLRWFYYGFTLSGERGVPRGRAGAFKGN